MTEIPMETIAGKLAGERIMLVGGAGFIGHNLALMLRRMEVETMVVDNMVINNLVNNAYNQTYGGKLDELRRQLYLGFLLERYDLMRNANVVLRNADARSFLDLSRCFDEFQPTKVVHLSAISSAVEARKDPGLCFDLQLVSLRNILELCRLSHDQVNHVMTMSSSTVYGDFEAATVDETVRPRPKGIYANTKFMAERLIRTYNHQYGISTCIIRPSALYGERCVSRRVSQVFVENALIGKPLLLEGGGDGRLDFTYIDDLIEGMTRALALLERHSSQTFNITFGNARTIAEIAEIVKDVIPGAILEERPQAEDKPIRGTLSTERAERVLGFKAKWPIETGYRRYCEWYVSAFERASKNFGG